MCVNERSPSEMMLQGTEAKKVEDFQYLGSTLPSNGECGKEVKKCVTLVEWVEKSVRCDV